MKKPLIIVGASGHGSVAQEIAELQGYESIYFLDDAVPAGANVLGRIADFEGYLEDCVFFVAIGNNNVRERIYNQLKSKGARLVSLIHPNATVSGRARVGDGVFIMAGAVVNVNAVIGNGVIVNTCSSVDHDCVLKDFSHISVGAHLAGTVEIGERTLVGAGATVINNLSVCDDCIVGAGAVVIRNICIKGTYVGVPTRRIK